MKWNWVDYAVILVLGVIFVSIGIEWFLVYALMALIIFLDVRVAYLKKLIRVLSITSETKINAIVKNLRIKNEEVMEVYEEAMKKVTPKQKTDLEKDMTDILG